MYVLADMVADGNVAKFKEEKWTKAFCLRITENNSILTENSFFFFCCCQFSSNMDEGNDGRYKLTFKLRRNNKCENIWRIFSKRILSSWLLLLLFFLNIKRQIRYIHRMREKERHKNWWKGNKKLKATHP